MKKLFFLILNFQFLIFNSFSQSPIQWQRALGGTSNEQAFFARQTADGGYVVAGIADSFDGDVTGHHLLWDCWLVKLSSAGNIEWQKCYGGSGEDEAFCVEQTADGGYAVAGLSESTDGDVTGNHGGWDCWVFKTDSTGNLLWEKSLGGTSVDGAASLQQTPDGGYIVAGYSQSTDGDVLGNHGANDMWLVKLDNSGNMQWQKSLGGSNSDGATSIQLASDGGFIIAGGTSSNDGDVTGYHGGGDMWLMKTDTAGNIQWQKCFGGSGDDYANSISKTNDGGYIISGRSSSNDGDVTGNQGSNDYWLIKTDNAGNIQWQKSTGGTGNEGAYSCSQTVDGGYIIAGGSFSNDGDVSGNHGAGDYWIVKTDSTGSIQWQKCFGGMGNDFANAVLQTADGGYLAAGTAYSNDGDVTGNHSPTTSDYWIIKLSPDVGIKDYYYNDKVLIYPNPANDQLSVIGYPLSGNYDLEIYCVFGNKVFPSPFSSPLLQERGTRGEVIDISSLSPGIYFIRIKTEWGYKTAKLIKE